MSLVSTAVSGLVMDCWEIAGLLAALGLLVSALMPKRNRLGRCERCGAELTDDSGASWPFCPVCDWCPDCGVSHEPHPDAREVMTWT